MNENSIIQEKKVNLLESFNDMNKTKDSNLSVEEANTFLNNNGIFLQETLNQIIKNTFFNQEIISVEEFIQNLLMYIQQIKEKSSNKNKVIEIENQLKLYENEILNEEGMSNESIIKIKFKSYKILKSDYESYSLSIIYKDKIFETKGFNSNNNSFENEYYEFKPESKNDAFKIELNGIKNNNKVKIDEKIYNINNNEINKSFSLELKIPQQIEIYGKITIILSNFEYYNNKLDKINNYKSILIQLESLGANKSINNEDQEEQENEDNNIGRLDIMLNDNMNNDVIPVRRNRNFLDFDKDLRHLRVPFISFNREDTIMLVVICAICISLSFFQSIYRNDFIGAFTSIFCIFCVVIANKFIIYSKIFVGITLLFDIYWFFYINHFFDEIENKSQLFCILFFIPGILVKSFLLFALIEITKRN
jgi:hypothetical protein